MDLADADGTCLSQRLGQVCLDAPSYRSLPPVDRAGPSNFEVDFDFARTEVGQEADTLCSQDFFCTPDYITPKDQQFTVDLDNRKENVPCQDSPMQMTPVRTKRPRPEPFISPLANIWANDNSNDSICPSQTSSPPEPPPAPPAQNTTLSKSTFKSVGTAIKRPPASSIKKVVSSAKVPEGGFKVGGYVPPNSRNRVSGSRLRIQSPPCFKNPFIREEEREGQGQVRKFAGVPPPQGSANWSRYKEEFHEIKEVGRGHFSRVHKVRKRIDGCLYAVKRTTRQLLNDNERKQALAEVQALAAAGMHENIVRYHTAWYESDYLYIQMELCEGSLAARRGTSVPERELLDLLHQVSRALQHLHTRGVVHLDVKPDNVYFVSQPSTSLPAPILRQRSADAADVSSSQLRAKDAFAGGAQGMEPPCSQVPHKAPVYKLGDFGLATAADGSLAIEEGDNRYMPLEIVNGEYRHLPKADVFSLGMMLYELARGAPLPTSGAQYQAIRQGRIILLPGCSMAFQSLLKAMLHPDPALRPSATDLLQNALLAKGL